MALRDSKVKTPRERKMKQASICLLLRAAYELVYAKDKWQNQLNETIFELGLQQSNSVLQHVFKKEVELVLFVVKIVDEQKVAGSGNHTKIFLNILDHKFKLGTVNKVPGTHSFFGINTVENDDENVEKDAN